MRDYEALPYIAPSLFCSYIEEAAMASVRTEAYLFIAAFSSLLERAIRSLACSSSPVNASNC